VNEKRFVRKCAENALEQKNIVALKKFDRDINEMLKTKSYCEANHLHASIASRNESRSRIISANVTA